MKKHVILLNITGKKPLQAEYQEVDVSNLKLDVLNPRIKSKHLKSDKAAENEIWEDQDTRTTLFLSIIESKGISEPIFIKQDGTVVEGNRRVVCLRKIKEKYAGNEEIFPKDRYTKIPAYVLPEDLDPVDLDVFLARLHVSGKKEWNALVQAQHIYNLKEIHGLTYDKIALLIGISRGKAFQKHWAFKETTKFLKKYTTENIKRFSFFEEAYKKSNVRKFLNSDENKKEFYGWIINKKFDKSGAKDIRDLAKFIDDVELFNTFKENGLKAAYIQYESKAQIEEDDLIKVGRELLNILKGMSHEELESFSKNKLKIALIKDIIKELNSLLEKNK